MAYLHKKVMIGTKLKPKLRDISKGDEIYRR